MGMLKEDLEDMCRVDMCGVEGKRRTSDLNVTGSRPPDSTKHNYTMCAVGH